jgi:methionyl-tRNA synthetase
MKNILIGGAWPYANGSLHMGHIAALLPGDIIARFHRALGDSVYYVSGSDCHGTPVTIRAKQEDKSPEEVSDFYHDEFLQCFQKLGFSYDCYTKTSSVEHKDFVRSFHKKLYESQYVYEKETEQAYCECCDTFLADRFVIGKCPDCGHDTRGDQCDSCGAILEQDNMIQPICAVCKNAISFRMTKHLYIAISKLDEKLKKFIDAHPHWRKNARIFSNRYIKEGLRDRSLTRDLSWGIDIPKDDYSNKKIYIWAENVLGYLSASKIVADKRGADYQALWGDDALHYYVHGKDNIPFHTIILPSLLIANGDNWHLPDEIISSEHLTLEGRKISTSQNYAIWVKDIVDRYNPDSLRYFLISNGPEKKDSDFSWHEYVKCHNGELLGAYGNFVNRTLVFVKKYFNGIVPQGQLEESIEKELDELFDTVGALIQSGHFKEALDGIFKVIRNANKFFDSEQPWITRNVDVDKCQQTIYTCVQVIANLSVILKPFLPFSSEQIHRWLELDNRWSKHIVKEGFLLPDTSILFERIEKTTVEEEVEKICKMGVKQ